MAASEPVAVRSAIPSRVPVTSFDPTPSATGADLAVMSLAVRDLAASRTPAQVADALARHAIALSGAVGAIVYLGRDGTAGYAALGRHGLVDPAAPDRLAAGRGDDASEASPDDASLDLECVIKSGS